MFDDGFVTELSDDAHFMSVALAMIARDDPGPSGKLALVVLEELGRPLDGHDMTEDQIRGLVSKGGEKA